MDGTRAALVVTDPPYNVAVESDSVGLAADGCSSILNEDMPEEEFAGFLHAVFGRYAASWTQLPRSKSSTNGFIRGSSKTP
ncbi:hypothetical protein D3C75_241910 [compost metagenome]